MVAVLLLSLSLAVAEPTPAFVARRDAIVAANDAWRTARAAGERTHSLAAARRLVAAAPDNPILRTFLAVSAVEAGDADLALETLEWLADRGHGLFDRAGARAALASLLDKPRHAALAGRLAANAAPAGDPKGVLPVAHGVGSEGITYDTRRDQVYLANADGLLRLAPDGSVSAVAGRDALNGRLVLGVRYDAGRDRVFVCASRPPGTPDPDAELVILHPAEPDRVERFALPASAQPRLCNDIAVLSDGAALTDTNTGEVFRYRDGGGLSRLTKIRFTYPNGIVQVGDRIVVGDLLGLWALTLDGRLLGQLRAPDGDYLGGTDGLAARGRTVLAVQSLTAPGRVISYRLAGDTSLRDGRLLASGAPELDGMTTAAIRGDSLLVLSGRPDGEGVARRSLVELALPDG